MSIKKNLFSCCPPYIYLSESVVSLVRDIISIFYILTRIYIDKSIFTSWDLENQATKKYKVNKVIVVAEPIK